MTSKLKCPFCLQELKKNESGAYYCTTKWCDLWGVIISRCAAEHFTQTTQDMLNTAKILATTEKDLEIARKALEEIKKHNKAMRSVLGEQIPEKSTDIEEYCWVTSCRIQDCLNALEQITHDNSEKANNVEHKEQK